MQRETLEREALHVQARRIGDWAETLMNHARYEEQRLTVFGGYVTVALVYGASGRNDLDIELLEIESRMEV